MILTPRLDDATPSKYAKVNKCRSSAFSDESEFEKPHINYLVQRNWFEVRDKLRAMYPLLTAEDVAYEPGRKNEMMRRIEEKLEVSPAKLQRIIAQL